MRYCDVIVDIDAEQLDRLFSYSIPEGMFLSVGQRVLAPFGPRKVEGYVLGFRDHVSLDPQKVRELIRPLEDYPAVLPELIELSKWMRGKYHATLSQCLKQMIPAQLRGERVREKTIRIARLLADGDELEDAIEKKKRAPVQVEILNQLKNGPLPTPVFQNAAALNALVKAGLIEIYEQESLRKPYKALDERRIIEPELMDAQRDAVQALSAAMDEGGGRFLLFGVTGSGKTEVYIHAIRKALSMGKTAIVLVPEIALTPQMVDWFRARFGDDAALLHSRLSPGERFDEWRRLRDGRARVAIGARSAVFAPLANIGIIIVDEEHEHSYKSDHHPCYDAREVAQKRAEDARAVLLLGSATPSIPSYMKAMPGVRPENKYTLLELNQRVMGRQLPEVEIVDMRKELALGNHSIFSAALQSALHQCVEAGHQAMLFLNRRGHSTFVSCRACGYVERCDQCDVAMVYHQHEHVLRCHYCGEHRRPPKACPQCGSQYIKFFGAGTQKIEEEVIKLLPGVPVLRMDMDTTRGKDGHEVILSQFRKGAARVLVGTQMIAKGLDFPNVTLVGVVAADMSLNMPDYRSVERTFQLITQVAGRAGRAENPGTVIVQTYDPDHYGIQLAAAQDYRAFYHEEARNRRRGLYPPFTLIARLLVVSEDGEAALRVSEHLEAELNQFLDGSGVRPDVVQMRALPAPLKRIRGESRYMVFLKMYARGDTEGALDFMEAQSRKTYEGCRVDLEINPNNML